MDTNTISGFKLSHQQERVWLQDGQSSFGASCTILIEGPLEPSRLRSALQSVLDRHEILRTVFHRQAGVKVPFQVIQEESSLRWETTSAGDHNGPNNEPLVVPPPIFDLENGPNVNAHLLRQEPDQHTLILQLPALTADTKSLQILVSELASYSMPILSNGRTNF